jgi:truncated hemoglobin YjbI
MTETHRQQWLRAFQRLHLAFLVDAQDQRFIFRYSPTTSRSFSMKNGSVDSLKLLLRFGCRPNSLM